MQLSIRVLLNRVVRWLVPHLFSTKFGWLCLRVARPFLVIALKNTKLTCSGKTDGGGSQILAILGVASFAKYFGAQFIHTPLTWVEHCPENERMEDFCARWETVVSLFNFTNSTGEEFIDYDLYDFLVDFLLFRTRGKLISLGNMHVITDSYPKIYEFLGVSRHETQNSPEFGKTRIFVHVRRGDVQPEGQNGFRYTSNERIRKNIDEVRKQVGEDSEVYIVTEAPDLAFEKTFADCRVISERDPVKALLLLVSADVLIMAKSAFSYLAALASTGKVFYEPYWQGPMPSWSILPMETS